MKNVSSIVPSNWDVDKEITVRLGSTAGRQRALVGQRQILVILHEPPLQDNNERLSIFFWKNNEGEWLTSERGNALSAMEDFLTSYTQLEFELEEQYDRAIHAKDYFALLEKVAPIQRAIKNTTKTLQEVREVVGGKFIDYRDKSEGIQRSIDLLYTDCKNGLEYAIAKKAEEQSEMQKQALSASHRLNIIMALFLPITAVASLLGMNIPHGLESAPKWTFIGIVLICSVVGCIMTKWVLGKNK